MNIINSKYLVDFIGIYCRYLKAQPNVADKRCVQQIIETIIEIVLEFKDREMYDSLSLRFIKSDIFYPLIKVICSFQIEPCEYKAIARVFELCACHSEGILIL